MSDTKISDAAAKLAEENEVDIATLTGTGAGGSITKGDVEKAIAAKNGDDDDDEDEEKDDDKTPDPAPKGDAVKVMWRNGSRVYTKERHGADFRALAEQFAEKVKGRLVAVAEGDDLTT